MGRLRLKGRARELPFVLVLRDREGKRLPGTAFWCSRRELPDQIRIVKPGQGFEDVSAADRAGRLDLIRCFLREPLAGEPARGSVIFYDEAPGHDRLEQNSPSFEVNPFPKLDQYPKVAELSARILETFPEGQLWPFEAHLLALYALTAAEMVGQYARDGQVDHARIERVLIEFCVRTGYTERLSQEQAEAAFGALPELFSRWLERDPTLGRLRERL